MKEKTFAVARALHIFAAIYNIIYVYTPLHGWEHGFQVVQFGSLPLLLVTGVAMVHLRKGGLA